MKKNKETERQKNETKKQTDRNKRQRKGKTERQAQIETEDRKIQRQSIERYCTVL